MVSGRERDNNRQNTQKDFSPSRKCVVGEIFKKSTEKRERMRELSKTAHRERARARERERKREKRNHRLVRAKTFKERERGKTNRRTFFIIVERPILFIITCALFSFFF